MWQKYITKSVRFVITNMRVLLQNATAIGNEDNVITKPDIYYKMRRLLQIATVHWSSVLAETDMLLNWLSLNSGDWNRAISQLFCKLSEQTKNWIISSPYLDDVNSAQKQDWKSKRFWYLAKNVSYAFPICTEQLIIGVSSTFHFNPNAYITLVISCIVISSDKEKRLIFNLLMLQKQILCRQFNSWVLSREVNECDLLNEINVVLINKWNAISFLAKNLVNIW